MLDKFIRRNLEKSPTVKKAVLYNHLKKQSKNKTKKSPIRNIYNGEIQQ
jgi:hypothetical protein